MSQGDAPYCGPTGPIKDPRVDLAPPYCRDDRGNCEDNSASLKDVPGQAESWIEEFTLDPMGNGEAVDCDPMLRGHIVNGQTGHHDRNAVYRYSKSLRGTDEAVTKLFSDIVVQDTKSQWFNVPIMWGTQEKAVMAIIGKNYRNDPTLVVDAVKLPLMSIHASNYEVDMKRYTYHKAVNYLRDYKQNWRPGFMVKERRDNDTVYGVSRGLPVNIGYELMVWTAYQEDIVQIMEQVIPKVSPMGYIRVRGAGWEIPVRLESMSNNIEYEPGDQSTRVIKFQFNLVAETYIAQPITRKKSVLSTRIEVVDRMEDDDIAEVLARLEQAVEESQ